MSPIVFTDFLQGVVDIQVKSLSIPAGFRPLPAQLDVFEVEKSFASGQVSREMSITVEHHKGVLIVARL